MATSRSSSAAFPPGSVRPYTINWTPTSPRPCENVDQKSKDYGDIKDKFRPGHADFTYMEKYGIRDYRGGGRSSARETAMRVAAGAVARKVLAHEIGSKVSLMSGGTPSTTQPMAGPWLSPKL